MKKYSHFQSVTTNNRKHVSDLISNNTDTFMDLLSNNTTHFSRHQTILTFSESSSMLNYSKNLFQSSYHTIMTLSESYYQTILTYSGLRSNSIHIFTELLRINSKHFLEILNGHLNRQKILKCKILN